MKRNIFKLTWRTRATKIVLKGFLLSLRSFLSSDLQNEMMVSWDWKCPKLRNILRLCMWTHLSYPYIFRESLVAAVLTELDSYSSSKPVPAPQISQPSLPQYPTPHPPQDRPASSQYSMPSHSPFQSPSLSQNPFAGPGASPFECATSPLPTSEHLSPLLLDEGSERLTDSTLQTSSDSQNSAVKRIQTSDPNFNPVRRTWFTDPYFHQQQIEELCNNAWNGGDIQDFQVLLSDMSIDAINSTNSRGQTALVPTFSFRFSPCQYCACRQGRQAHVETLLQIRGIDINKGETVKQGTPLHGT